MPDPFEQDDILDEVETWYLSHSAREKLAWLRSLPPLDPKRVEGEMYLRYIREKYAGIDPMDGNFER